MMTATNDLRQMLQKRKLRRQSHDHELRVLKLCAGSDPEATAEALAKLATSEGPGGKTGPLLAAMRAKFGN